VVGIPLSNAGGNFIPDTGGNAVPFRFEPNAPPPAFEFPLPSGVPPQSETLSNYNPQMPLQNQNPAGVNLVSFALAHTPSRDVRTTVDMP
jgi:hypothetical protein